LNQYTQRALPTGIDGVFDVAGAIGSGTVFVEGSSTGVTKHGDYFFKSHTMDNTPHAVFDDIEIDDDLLALPNPLDSLPAFLRGAPEMKSYDEDGNLLSDGRWVYRYDAENRLVEMFSRGAPSYTGFDGDPILTSGTQAEIDAANAVWNIPQARQRLVFEYDYMHRRVRKVDYDWTTAWTGVTERRFIYDGWNPLAEYWGAFSSGNLVTTNSRYSFWGLDITGSLTTAGGVGALLMTHVDGKIYIPAYDQLGNIHILLDSFDGTIAAAYEYDSFGVVVRSSGIAAADNPYRSASKYTDIETGLVYYGRRYYDPKDGRFVGRDPIEEQGGINLYAFVMNRPVNSWDYAGMNMEGRFFESLSDEAKESFRRQILAERRALRNLNYLNEQKQAMKAFVDGGGSSSHMERINDFFTSLIDSGFLKPTADSPEVEGDFTQLINAQGEVIDTLNGTYTLDEARELLATSDVPEGNVAIGELEFLGFEEEQQIIPSAPFPSSPEGLAVRSEEAVIAIVNADFDRQLARRNAVDPFEAIVNSINEDAHIYRFGTNLQYVPTIAMATTGAGAVGRVGRVAVPVVRDAGRMLARDGRALARAAGEAFDDVGRYIYTRSPSTVDFVEGVVWSAGIAGGRSGYHGSVPSGFIFAGGQFAGLINIDEWEPGD